MTDTSPPPLGIEWEPMPEGVKLTFDSDPGHDEPYVFGMPMMSVRELRDDMEEAAMLARGFAKVEDFAQTIIPGDLITLMGDSYEVENTLQAGLPGYKGDEEYECVLQFKLNTYSPVQAELTFPPDQLVTYWRRIE